jgi:hypothetical protein
VTEAAVTVPRLLSLVQCLHVPYLATAITLSVLSFFYLETPLRRLFTKPSNVFPYATAYLRKLRPQHG